MDVIASMPSDQGDAEDLPAFRRHELGKPADIALGLRAMTAGALACWMTGAIAGIFLG